MKKVLFVATVQSHIAQFHKPVIKMLQSLGCEVDVAARDNLAEKNNLLLTEPNRIFDVPFFRSPFNIKNVKAYRQLKKIINENDYDLIVCNTPVGGVLTRIAAKRARKNGTKVVYIAHGFHFYKGASIKNWLIYYPIEKHFAKKCDMLITINEEDYLLAKKKFKVQVERIHGIGVDPRRYFPVSVDEKVKRKLSFGYDKNLFLILVVGELLPNKNQIQAIKAVEEVLKTNSNVKLLIAGNGKEQKTLENYVKEKNLTNYVEFLGYCTHLEDYQSFVDLGVSCSIREGLGLNVVESMMSGNTFIATKNRGHNELIKDGINGYLVELGDYKTLAEKINLLIKNRELKGKLADNAINMIQSYVLEKVLDEFKQILSKLDDKDTCF